MKKVLIYVLSAIVLLGLGFFLGFTFGLDDQKDNQAQKEETELVEEDVLVREKQHELNSPLDIKRLASMMLEEKSTQHFNEAMYVSYLVDSVGFVMDERFCRYWWKPGHRLFVGGGMTLDLDSHISDGRCHRYIKIEDVPSGSFLRDLTELGLKYLEGEDGFCEYEGNGLYAATSPHSISFGVDAFDMK